MLGVGDSIGGGDVDGGQGEILLHHSVTALSIDTFTDTTT